MLVINGLDVKIPISMCDKHVGDEPHRRIKLIGPNEKAQWKLKDFKVKEGKEKYVLGRYVNLEKAKNFVIRDLTRRLEYTKLNRDERAEGVWFN